MWSERPVQAKSLLLLAIALTVPLGVAAAFPFRFPLPTYLALHTLMELSAVVMAAVLAAVGLVTARASRARGVTFLALGFLAVAAFDTFHLMSYQGMPAFVSPSGPSKAIYFWLAARITAAISLLVYALRPRRADPDLGLYALTGVWIAGATWLILTQEARLPAVFVEGVGLTPLKQGIELVLCLSYLAVVPLLARTPDGPRLISHDRLAQAAVAMAVSEAAFCLYEGVTDGFNFIGHVEKIVAYALLYGAVFRGAVRDPYLRLAASVAELRASEARFRELAGAIDEVFFLTDARTGALLYMSPAAERITQRAVSDLGSAPENFFPYVHPDDRGRLGNLTATAHAQEATTELRILRPDGSERWVVVRAGPVRDAAGQVYRIAGVARDATDEKHLQAQLASAQRMETVSRLAAGVAHDFNNLLTVILTATSFARDAVEAHQEGLRDDIGSIEAAARRAQALTRQLLTLARKDRSPSRVVDLGAVVRDLLPMIERLVGVEVKVEAQIAPGPHPVTASPTQIEQLIVNLVVNARDAMPTGGLLRLEVGPAAAPTGDAPPRVSLEVADTGVGMTDEVREHAFEPFFTTKPEGKGTGLGLATCYGTVRDLGGELRLDSTLGVGTRVVAVLPRAAGAAIPVAGPAAVTPGRGERVLVVDDEPAVRRSAARALAALGFAPVEAGSGDEALGRLAALPDLAALLTDVRMPGMGGDELAVRALGVRPGLRVLFMSGYADKELPGTLLQKPFTTEELGETLRRVLDGSASA